MIISHKATEITKKMRRMQRRTESIGENTKAEER
jgi:hypothetical protein